MTSTELDAIFKAANPEGEGIEPRMRLFTPTYDSRTWDIAVTNKDEVVIRIVNEQDPDHIVAQQLFLSKNSFAQLYFFLTSIVVEHVDIDEKYVTDWVASFDNIG
jgi:hypothetical protein